MRLTVWLSALLAVWMFACWGTGRGQASSSTGVDSSSSSSATEGDHSAGRLNRTRRGITIAFTKAKPKIPKVQVVIVKPNILKEIFGIKKKIFQQVGMTVFGLLSPILTKIVGPKPAPAKMVMMPPPPPPKKITQPMMLPHPAPPSMVPWMLKMQTPYPPPPNPPPGPSPVPTPAEVKWPPTPDYWSTTPWPKPPSPWPPGGRWMPVTLLTQASTAATALGGPAPVVTRLPPNRSPTSATTAGTHDPWTQVMVSAMRQNQHLWQAINEANQASSDPVRGSGGGGGGGGPTHQLHHFPPRGFIVSGFSHPMPLFRQGQHVPVFATSSTPSGTTMDVPMIITPREPLYTTSASGAPDTASEGEEASSSTEEETAPSDAPSETPAEEVEDSSTSERENEESENEIDLDYGNSTSTAFNEPLLEEAYNGTITTELDSAKSSEEP